MTNYPRNLIEELFEYEAWSAEAITLEPDEIDQAVQLSSQITNETRKWQAYLNALALFGFDEWLNERTRDIPVDRENCSALQPQYANVIDAVCNLRVGEFKLCLLTTGTLIDQAVTLPRAAIDLPEYAAHFYVVLEVQEEQEKVTVRGFQRYDQLLDRLQSANLQQDERDWTYNLPLAWFDSHLDRLLLYLRCLEPTAIPVPSVPNHRIASLSSAQAELREKLLQLQSPDCTLSQVLTWEQAAVVLTTPDLVDWLYRWQTHEQSDGRSIASLTCHLSVVLQGLTQQVVNVGLWLRDELDEYVRNLSWIILPTPAPASQMRSLRVATGETPTEEFKAIISKLTATGMQIPLEARGAYREFKLGEISLRLYAITWLLLSQGNTPEWTLLLVLGAQPGTALPDRIKLQVSDQASVLVERVLEQNSDDTYLYTRVVGTQEEKFLVTIALINGEALTLPAFAFLPPAQPL